MMDVSNLRHMHTAMDGTVSFLPAMMDVSNSTQPVSSRHSAMSLMWTDIKLMAANMMRCLPEMIRSLYAMDLGRSMMKTMDMMDVKEVCLHVLLGIMQICMVVMCIPVCMMLPGVMLAPITLCCVGMCMMLCWPMNNGKMVIRCECCPDRMGSDMMAEERWFHVNGSMTR